MFDRTLLEVQGAFDDGAWDVGAMRFNGRHLTQIEASKGDQFKSDRLLTAKEVTRYRGGLGSIR